jgi:hypothetical protein
LASLLKGKEWICAELGRRLTRGLYTVEGEREIIRETYIYCTVIMTGKTKNSNKDNFSSTFFHFLAVQTEA